MKKPGDKSPDPPGGRAAERLRQFEEARLPPEEREQRQKDEVQPSQPSHTKKKKKEKNEENG